MVAETVRRELRAGRSCAFVVWGKSMWPTIRPGTRVIFDPCSAVEAIEGDILLVDHNGSFIAHRALRREHGGWWLVDDRSAAFETYVNDVAVLGRAQDVFVLGRRAVSRDRAAKLLPAIGRATRALVTVRPIAGEIAARIGAVPPIARLRGALQPWSIARENGAPELALRAGRYPRSSRSWEGVVHVARSHRRVVGWARIAPDGELEFWVDVWFRDLGIATALLDASIASARELALDAIWARGAIRARDWLERRGFAPGERLVLAI
jgi:hypothetical protein